MVLPRGAAPAAGGVTLWPTVSRAWRLHLTLRQASGPAVPAGGRRGALRVRAIRPVVRTAPDVRPTPVVPLTAAAPPGQGGSPGRAVAGAIVTAAVRHIAQRIVERGQRVEERTAAPDPASGLSGYPYRPDLGWMPGPSLMAAARPTRFQAREHGHGAADGPAPGAPEPRRILDAPPTQPRIDVEQLADQVVRRIDDRITAHRERLGRI